MAFIHPLKTTDFGKEFKLNMDMLKRMDAVKTLTNKRENAVVLQYGLDKHGNIICLAQTPDGSDYYVGSGVWYNGGGDLYWAMAKHYKTYSPQIKQYQSKAIGTIKFAPSNLVQ